MEAEPLAASLLSDVLRTQNFEVQTATDAAEARLAVNSFEPDGVLIDISLAHAPTGLNLAHVLHLRRRDHGQLNAPRPR